MQHKMSTHSASSGREVKKHGRSRSFLQSMLGSTGSQKVKTKQKAMDYSKKLSSSFNKKTEDGIKITHQNFREVLIGLTHKILTGNEKGKQLLQSVANYLKKDNATLDQQVHTLLIDIDYKKDTFDLLTPLKTIQTEILKSVLKKTNPVGRIAFELWYNYLHDKYNVDKFQNFQKYWIKDIIVFKQFFANVVYQIYGQWVFLIQKKKDMFPYIWKQFIPYVLTSHPSFDIVYKIAIRHFGEVPLTISNDLKPSFFDIKPEFSCEQSQVPFEKTIQIVKDIYRECGLKKKIIKIKQLSITLKQQLRTNQDLRISKKLQQVQKEIDTDNIANCLTYCIYKTGYGGLFEALQYLQLFFIDDEKQKSSDYIQGLRIGHIMASLQTAALSLRQICKE